MEHPDAPPGKSLKYTLVERERRFLLRALPHGPCIRRAEITDRYLRGTRLRVREAVETMADGTTTVRKLTQKIPAPGGGPGLITTLYLSEAEHAVLSTLPGDVLRKTRLSVPPLGVDVFRGALEGLVVAEIEFESAAEHDAFVAPADSAAEVTHDARFTGGRYLTTTRSELLGWLADHEVEPLDATELLRRPLTAWPP